jgi:hypothetical protein
LQDWVHALRGELAAGCARYRACAPRDERREVVASDDAPLLSEREG